MNFSVAFQECVIIMLRSVSRNRIAESKETNIFNTREPVPINRFPQRLCQFTLPWLRIPFSLTLPNLGLTDILMTKGTNEVGKSNAQFAMLGAGILT